MHTFSPPHDSASAPRSVPDVRYGHLLAAILAALTCYRFLALGAADLQLYFDEAYYWIWSTQPAFGYYSKPPMIAWLMGLAGSVCGEGEMCLRSGALLLYPLTAWLIHAAGTRLFGPRIGFFAGLAYATLPVVAFYSWLMTTDALLSFFWSLALYGLVRALEGDRWRDWLLTGTALGLGLLSKYTMLLFLPSVLLYFLVAPERRRCFRSRKALAGLVLAGLLFLPNLAWNLANGNASFQHTAAIAHWNREWFHPDRLLVFLGGQALLFGPLLALAPFFCRWKSGPAVLKDERYRFLLCFTVPMLALFSVQALIARANLNWAMAAFVPASMLAAAYLTGAGRQRWLIAALVLNVMLGSLVYHYGALAERFGIQLGHRADAYAEMKGWRELGQEVQGALSRYPGAGLASDNRRVLSELVYYVQPHPLDGAIWNPSGEISDHFRLKADLAQSDREGFIFVTRVIPADALRPHFEEVVDLGLKEIVVHPDHALRYRMIFVRHFLGYKS